MTNDKNKPDQSGIPQESVGQSPGSGAHFKTQQSPPATEAPHPLTDEEAELGHALRTIYSQTVEEAIPDAMLELLRRLD